MTRSMIKAAEQSGSKPVKQEQSGSKPVKQEQSIIRTRSQKLREALVRNRSVLEEINTFYTANQREPSAESEDADERWLAGYIQRMRWEWQRGAFGRAIPELIAEVEDIIPWFVWADPKENLATAAATATAATDGVVAQSPKIRYTTLLDLATLMLFLYSLGRFVNSVYLHPQQMNWSTTLSPGAWGLWSWGLWA